MQPTNVSLASLMQKCSPRMHYWERPNRAYPASARWLALELTISRLRSLLTSAGNKMGESARVTAPSTKSIARVAIHAPPLSPLMRRSSLFAAGLGQLRPGAPPLAKQVVGEEISNFERVEANAAVRFVAPL